MSVSEWSGVASASALDVQGNSSGSSATTATSPALTTTNATDVVIGALNYTGSATSTAGGTGFAPLSNFDVSSTHGRASYNVTTTAGSYQASWSLSAASSYGAAALALKAGSTGPTDTTPPTTSITCNSSACSSSAYSAAVQVALSATDSGGSGLKTTYYTTDGSDPTSSASRTAYSSPFTLNTTTTVKYSSVDNANNVENVKSQTITINTDTTPPTTSITCNSSACSSSAYSAAVSGRALGDRQRRLRPQNHLLHNRRQRPNQLRQPHRLQQPVHPQHDHHGQVLLRRQRQQRRKRQVTDDHDQHRHDPADNLDHL